MENKTQYKYTNSLINQTSPYLLQHAHNPVNWYAWSDAAFDKAKHEDKLILISIGYAACHWCHVMEHESFENEAVANEMNDNFICIKVDREERPDVDQIYMSAVQLLTGRGGWPLNCFALPDGRPIYGGTYFKPDQWTELLQGLALTYKKDKQRVINAADEISAGIKNYDLIPAKKPKLNFSTYQVDKLMEAWEPSFDVEWGGNRGAPKFPLPASLQLLLQSAFHSDNEEVFKHLKLTLEKIGNGGIYDHVGGGFARYAVDKKWMVPHFEKMLYDNGQLISLYANAYKLTKNNFYRQKIEQTLAFITREMTTPEGAFYSSYDADSEEKEGKFYVWKKSEIEKLLGEESTWFCEYFNVTDPGNWELDNILWITNHNAVLKKYKFTEKAFTVKLNSAIKILFNERKKRIHPGLDDKILTSWNALMSIGFLDAYEALGNENYLHTALKNASFIKTQMLQTDGSLKRNYKNGESNITAFLDDYALAIQLFTKIYQNTFDEDWLMLAKRLTAYTLQHFQDADSLLFYYTADNGEQLIARKMEIIDNVIPSSNSIMANNLFDLGTILSNKNWIKLSSQMLSNGLSGMEKNVRYYANWGILLYKFSYPFYEVVFTGPNALNLKQSFVQNLHPNIIMAGAVSESKNKLPLLENRIQSNESLIYICQDKACNLPVKTINETEILILNN